MIKRPRRLRANPGIRALVRETHLSPEQLVYPLFVVEGEGIKEEIPSMPGVFHFSLDRLEEEIAELQQAQVPAVLLFGVPQYKDAIGSAAYDENGLVPNAIRCIRQLCPSMVILADVCLCQYTDHGHCGVLSEDGTVDNDKTLPYLAAAALSYAKAGADLVAPSDMMDGRVAAIRRTLDDNGYHQVGILAYSAKYASSFYGPFREAAHSAPAFGDRRSYQMDVCNAVEALREVELDVEEGADIVMVKPAMPYLDVIRRCKEQFAVPLCAYQVSGEYAMLQAAVRQGLLPQEAILESVLSIKRAGADVIITYFAKELCSKLTRGEETR